MPCLSPDAVLAVKEAAAKAMIFATNTVKYQSACSETVAPILRSPHHAPPLLPPFSQLVAVTLDATEASV